MIFAAALRFVPSAGANIAFCMKTILTGHTKLIT